jgi:hypothetical protein
MEKRNIADYLDYNKDTGEFTWIKRPSARILKGDKAGYIFTADSGHQYLQITFNRKKYYAHRLAFLLVEGAYPTNHIFHKNGDTLHNAWSNLTVGKPDRPVNMVWKKL